MKGQGVKESRYEGQRVKLRGVRYEGVKIRGCEGNKSIHDKNERHAEQDDDARGGTESCADGNLCGCDGNMEPSMLLQLMI